MKSLAPKKLKNNFFLKKYWLEYKESSWVSLGFLISEFWWAHFDLGTRVTVSSSESEGLAAVAIKVQIVSSRVRWKNECGLGDDYRLPSFLPLSPGRWEQWNDGFCSFAARWNTHNDINKRDSLIYSVNILHPQSLTQKYKTHS